MWRVSAWFRSAPPFLLNPPNLLSSSSRRPTTCPTHRSRALSPAWSPSWCGGCPAGRSSCLLWPSGRPSSTTATASRSPTRSRSLRGPPHCHWEPRLSSPSPPLTPAGRNVWCSQQNGLELATGIKDGVVIISTACFKSEMDLLDIYWFKLQIVQVDLLMVSMKLKSFNRDKLSDVKVAEHHAEL